MVGYVRNTSSMSNCLTAIVNDIATFCKRQHRLYISPRDHKTYIPSFPAWIDPFPNNSLQFLLRPLPGKQTVFIFSVKKSLANLIYSDVLLKTVQSLAAQMKIVIDASEHLWRFMERRQFLQATWLFLLCRVVHRSLLHPDAATAANWSQHGIDVNVLDILL